jgi:hypothetical protein
MDCIRIVYRVLLAAVVSFAVAATALAESRPHQWQGTGHFVSANDFVSEGQATHLGNFHEAAFLQFAPTDDPAVLQIEGIAILTGANGDELHEVFTGTLNLQTGAAALSITYVGGTGRFADASGTAILLGQLFPDGHVEFAGEGILDY